MNGDKRKALKRHTFEFYSELEKRSEVNEYGIRVFVGEYTKVLTEMKVSTTHWSAIREILITSGCISIVQRGTAHQPSIVVLITEPTDENYSAGSLTSAPHPAILVASLEKRVAALEAWFITLGGDKVNFAEIVRNHERRITKVEVGMERASEPNQTTPKGNNQ
jgi:uncharacterized protein with NAD-binding domain and iron-sulfur cluster